MELTQYHAADLSKLLEKREVSSEEITQAYLSKIDRTNSVLNSFINVTPELALSMARKADQQRAVGNGKHPLMGIPIAIKDNINIETIPTTCASKILSGFTPSYNATVIEKILHAGCPIIGKTNLDEFAMGSSTENSAFGPSLNPWDTTRVPGGSSGGSAVAVSSGQVPLALGSDTGGSIRQPASLCGVVGFKPTYGRVSRFGLVAFASSLDQIGTFSKNVEDAAWLYQVIAGHDIHDSTSQNIAVEEITPHLNKSIKGMKVALPEELFVHLTPDIKKEYDRVVDQLSKEGVIVETIKLPSLQYALSTYYIIAPAEASSNLARYDGVRFGYRSPRADNLIDMMTHSRSEGFGPEVKRRILIGTYVLSSGYYDAYYRKAMQVRTLIKEDFKKTFETFDAILSPTTPTPAFKLGEKAADPLQMYLSDVMTIPANMAGLPAISIPCGLVDSMPMGLQIMTNHFEEAKMLNIAYQFEQIFNFDVCRNPYSEGEAS